MFVPYRSNQPYPRYGGFRRSVVCVDDILGFFKSCRQKVFAHSVMRPCPVAERVIHGGFGRLAVIQCRESNAHARAPEAPDQPRRTEMASTNTPAGQVGFTAPAIMRILPHTKIDMHKLLGLTLFVIVALLPGAAYPDVYGGCIDSAQSYQDRYRASQQVKDLVCMQRALERELGARGRPRQRTAAQEYVQPVPKTGSNYSRQETYCLEHLYGKPEAEYRTCVVDQERAWQKIEAFIAAGRLESHRSKVGTCTGYTIGFRSLGSMENVDSVPIAQCIASTIASPMFALCVPIVTGRAWNDGEAIFWNAKAASQIAECFNQRMAQSSTSAP